MSADGHSVPPLNGTPSCDTPTTRSVGCSGGAPEKPSVSALLGSSEPVPSSTGRPALPARPPPSSVHGSYGNAPMSAGEPSRSGGLLGEPVLMHGEPGSRW